MSTSQPAGAPATSDWDAIDENVRVLQTGSNAQWGHKATMISYAKTVAATHPDCRLFLGFQSAYSTDMYFFAHNLEAYKPIFKETFTEACAQSGKREVVARLRKELTELLPPVVAAKFTERFMTLCEEADLVGRQHANMIRRFVTAADEDQGRQGLIAFYCPCWYFSFTSVCVHVQHLEYSAWIAAVTGLPPICCHSFQRCVCLHAHAAMMKLGPSKKGKGGAASSLRTEVTAGGGGHRTDAGNEGGFCLSGSAMVVHCLLPSGANPARLSKC